MKGSVFRRGKKWAFVVDLPRDESGKRRQKKSSFATKKEAEAALAKLIAKVESGTYVEPEKITVGDYLGSGSKTSDPQCERARFALMPGS